jgi:hypothetical protein
LQSLCGLLLFKLLLSLSLLSAILSHAYHFYISTFGFCMSR